MSKRPLAYLTKANCLWMQDPNDQDRYIPNPNATGSYPESYCIECGHIPIYDPKLIQHFEMQSLINFFNYNSSEK